MKLHVFGQGLAGQSRHAHDLAGQDDQEACSRVDLDIAYRNLEIAWPAIYRIYALFGALFVSLGIFASTLTKNQIIAAVIAFTGLIVLFGVPLTRGLMVSSSWLTAAIDHADLWQHMADYSKGIVDTRHVIYQLSAGVLFLFLAAKSLEVKKWR